MKIISITLLLEALFVLTQCTSEPCKSEFDINSKLIGICKIVDQCAGAALKSNCSTDGHVCCVSDNNPPKKVPHKIITEAIFLKISGKTDRNKALYPYFVESLDVAGIKTEFQIAAYLSQLIHETEYFRKIESTIFEKDENQLLGNNQVGDGILFRGRGGILLRGRSLYKRANDQNNLGPLDIEPELVSFPSIAFKVAAWFWTKNAYVVKDTNTAKVTNLNEMADGTFLGFTQLTHSITVRLKSLKERALINELILKEFSETSSLKRGEGISCKLNDGTEGYAVPICLYDFRRPYCGCEGRYEIQTCPYGRNEKNECRGSSILKCCVEMCSVSLDLVIVLDKSSSIGASNFKKEQMFVKNLLKKLDIGINKTRVSIIEFNRNYKILTTLKDGISKNILDNAIDSIVYKDTYGTNTAKALEAVNQKILKFDNGMREKSIPKVVLTITDGRSQQPEETKIQADKIKERNINMVSVGIAQARVKELLTLATTSNDQYYVTDFDKVLSIVNDLSKTTCRQPLDIDEVDEIKTEVDQYSYKYFRFKLNPDKGTGLIAKNLTIELQEMIGSTELFYSFADSNPKSENDYLNATDELDQNYHESGVVILDSIHKFTKFSEISVKTKAFDLTSVNRTQYYRVSNTDRLSPLFISVRGNEIKNDFKLMISDLTADCMEEGRSGVAGDCTKYIECINGQLFNYTCNDVESPYFDIVSKKCQDKEDAKCYVEFEKECLTDGEKYGIEGNCNQYKECVNGILETRKCDINIEKSYFDIVTKECTDADDAQCFINLTCVSKYDNNPEMVGECKSVDLCVGAALASNCSTKEHICCVPDPNEDIPEGENKLISKKQFLNISGNTIRNEVIYRYFIESLNLINITTEYQLAAYLSQLVDETDNFRKIESIIMEVDDNNQLGNNQAGDGVTYRGRGGILLRGRKNYDLANNATESELIKNSGVYNLPFDIFSEPERVSFPSVAFKTAAWFWAKNAYVVKDNDTAKVTNLNEMADGTFLGFTQLTHSVTSKLSNLKKRALINENVLEKLSKTSFIRRGEGISCKLNDGTEGYAVPICLYDFRRPYCGCEGRYEIQTCPYGRNEKNECRGSSILKCCVEYCYSDLDLVILIDSSGSINYADKSNFDKIKNFTKNIVHSFQIGENKTRVSIINYSKRAQIEISLKDGTNFEKVEKAITNMTYLNSTTNTPQALEFANRMLTLENGTRPKKDGIPKVVLTITDGLTTNDFKDNLKPSVEQLKRREINLIAVGISQNDGFVNELLEISSSSYDQYFVEDFDKVESIVKELTKTTCLQSAELENQAEVVQTVSKNSYKYFKYALNPSEKNITLVLNDIEGNTQLFYSFEDKRPKDDAGYITSDYTKRSDYVKKFENSDEILNSKTKYYKIQVQNESERLFISAIGYEDINKFQIIVFNRTLNQENTNESNFHRSIHGSNLKHYTLYAILFQALLFYL